MEIEKIELEVKATLAYKLGIDDVDYIKLEDNLRNDLGADSLDLIEITMDLERKFDILIPDERYEHALTVQDIVNGLFETLKEKEDSK